MVHGTVWLDGNRFQAGFTTVKVKHVGTFNSKVVNLVFLKATLTPNLDVLVTPNSLSPASKNQANSTLAINLTPDS